MKDKYHKPLLSSISGYIRGIFSPVGKFLSMPLDDGVAYLLENGAEKTADMLMRIKPATRELYFRKFPLEFRISVLLELSISASRQLLTTLDIRDLLKLAEADDDICLSIMSVLPEDDIYSFFLKLSPDKSGRVFSLLDVRQAEFLLFSLPMLRRKKILSRQNSAFRAVFFSGLNLQGILPLLTVLPTRLAADILTKMKFDKALYFWRNLETEFCARMFQFLDDKVRIYIVQKLSQEKAVGVLSYIEPVQMIRVVSALPPGIRRNMMIDIASRREWMGKPVPRVPSYYYPFVISGRETKRITSTIDSVKVYQVRDRVLAHTRDRTERVLGIKRLKIHPSFKRAILKGIVRQLEKNNYTLRETSADAFVRIAVSKLGPRIYREILPVLHTAALKYSSDDLALLMASMYIDLAYTTYSELKEGINSRDPEDILVSLRQLLADRVDECRKKILTGGAFRGYRSGFISNIEGIKDSGEIIKRLKNTASYAELRDTYRLELTRSNAYPASAGDGRHHKNIFQKLNKRLKFFARLPLVRSCLLMIEDELRKVSIFEGEESREIQFIPAKDASILFKSIIGKDCSAPDSLAHMMHPRSVVYKLFVQGEWRGYLQVVEAVNSRQEKALQIDVFNLDSSVSLNYTRLWQQLVQELASLADSAGFRYILASTNVDSSFNGVGHISNQDFIRISFSKNFSSCPVTGDFHVIPRGHFQTEDDTFYILWQSEEAERNIRRGVRAVR